MINKKLVIALIPLFMCLGFQGSRADWGECNALKGVAARNRNNPPDEMDGQRRKIEAMLIAGANSRYLPRHGCTLLSIDYAVSYLREVTTTTGPWWRKQTSTRLERVPKFLLTVQTGNTCPAHNPNKKLFVENFGEDRSTQFLGGGPSWSSALWHQPCATQVVSNVDNPIVDIKSILWCCPNVECQYRDPNKDFAQDKLEKALEDIENEVAQVVSNMAPPPIACDLHVEVTDRRGVAEQLKTVLGLSEDASPTIEWDWQKDRNGDGEDDGYEPVEPQLGVYSPLDCDFSPRGLAYRGYHSQGYEMNRAFLHDSQGRACGHVKACLFCAGGEDIAIGGGEEEELGEPFNPETDYPGYPEERYTP